MRLLSLISNFTILAGLLSAERFLIQVNPSFTFSHSDLYNTIDLFEIGDVSVYVSEYDSFPYHLYNEQGVLRIELDQEIFVENHFFRNKQKVMTKNNMVNLNSYYMQKDPIWNLDRLDQRSNALNNKYYYYTSSGKGSNVYILDTGIDVSHPEFEGRATFAFNGVDSINTDCNNHGTHVAGTVGSKSYGVAKAVNLIAVKVLDCKGSGSFSSILAGLEYIIKNADKNRASIVNMSLGGQYSTILNNAVAQLPKNGIHVIAAAGNENVDACTTSPASDPSVFTVGAVTQQGSLAAFSNWGKCVNILSPGTDILSTIPKNSQTKMQGTSMASPHVAGVYALILSDSPKITPDAMKKLVVKSCTNGVISGLKPETPNCLLFSLDV